MKNVDGKSSKITKLHPLRIFKRDIIKIKVQ